MSNSSYFLEQSLHLCLGKDLFYHLVVDLPLQLAKDKGFICFKFIISFYIQTNKFRHNFLILTCSSQQLFFTFKNYSYGRQSKKPGISKSGSKPIIKQG
jgi:hypothetical protein